MTHTHIRIHRSRYSFFRTFISFYIILVVVVSQLRRTWFFVVDFIFFSLTEYFHLFKSFFHLFLYSDYAFGLFAFRNIRGALFSFINILQRETFRTFLFWIIDWSIWTGYMTTNNSVSKPFASSSSSSLSEHDEWTRAQNRWWKMWSTKRTKCIANKRNTRNISIICWLWYFFIFFFFFYSSLKWIRRSFWCFHRIKTKKKTRKIINDLKLKRMMTL